MKPKLANLPENATPRDTKGAESTAAPHLLRATSKLKSSSGPDHRGVTKITMGRSSKPRGRDYECNLLLTKLDLVLRGESGAVLIEGDVGSGKTFLLQFVLSHAQLLGGLKCIALAGSHHGQRTPFHLFRALVGELVGVQQASSSEESVKLLSEKLPEQFTYLAAAEQNRG